MIEQFSFILTKHSETKQSKFDKGREERENRMNLPSHGKKGTEERSTQFHLHFSFLLIHRGNKGEGANQPVRVRREENERSFDSTN